MYWIYVALFLMAVAAPEVIRDRFLGIPEEEAETLFIFVFGAVGFFLTFAKEKSLLLHIREKVLLQREKSDMSKDLSESYSYIGTANRKLDLVSGLMLSLPDAADRFRKGETDGVYEGLSEVVRSFCRTDSFVLRVVDDARKEVVKEIRAGKNPSFQPFTPERLLASGSAVREEEGCLVARSPKTSGGRVAFLVFPKVSNSTEDQRTFQTLAATGLLLSLLEERYSKDAIEDVCA